MDHPGMDMETLAAIGNGPPRKPSRVLPIVLGVAALLIALIALGVVSAVRSLSGTSSAATAVANSFVAAIGAHDFRGASALCAPQEQAHMSPSALKGLEALVEQTQGSYVSAGVPAWYVQNWNGQTSVRLTYRARYANGAETITVVMVNTADGYRVYRVSYGL